jgi:Fe-S-cluster-containing hydrogenase component 2
MVREIRLQINDERCRACRRCLAAEACKVRAIVRLDSDESPFLEVSRCYDCRLCILACPFKAIAVVNRSRISEEDHGGIRH